jgi:hypothetical protein
VECLRIRPDAPMLQVDSGPGRGVAHLSWRAAKVPAMRYPNVVAIEAIAVYYRKL